MKKGLSYISERTGEIRAADNAENIKWFHPLSEYIPIETIRRGEAVSIATVEDINEIAENIYSNNADKAAALKAALTATTNSYIVRTRPSRHTSAIGLAEEYVKVEIIKNEDGSYTINGKISLNELNDELERDINFDDYESKTLGGLSIEILNRFPKEKDEFFIEDLHFIIEKTDKRRVVKLTLLPFVSLKP